MTNRERRVMRLQYIGGEWVLREARQTIATFGPRTKRQAEQQARGMCRYRHRQGDLVQLVIHNRDGGIGQGGRSEATYGNDPRRSRG